MKVKAVIFSLICALSVAILPSCLTAATPAQKCVIVFEENPQVYIPQQVYEINKNSSLSVALYIPYGTAITKINYENNTLTKTSSSETSGKNFYHLTLYAVKYSTLIRFTVENDFTTTYSPNGGEGESFTLSSVSPHIKPNSEYWQGQFKKEGYVATGWTTAENGGEHIGFGSRFESKGDTILYCEWTACSPQNDFTYCRNDDGLAITSFSGSGNAAIPESIDGLTVTEIKEGAFKNAAYEKIVLPSSIKSIAPSAFENITCKALYFFDNLTDVSDESFESCEITTLYLNAARAPVYSRNYFATYADKVDRLESVKDKKKIVFFCGSSARFGYDSTRFVEEFPDYTVANMGVFAYSEMLPQAEITEKYLTSGDIVISSPELDAIDKQFCANRAFDESTFCLSENNYAMLSLLDLREYKDVFSSFATYNAVRATMDETSYSDSPSRYDEDGARVAEPSYNTYGDYIVYRKNNSEGKIFSEAKQAYFNPDHISESDFAGLNAVYSSFKKRGAEVFFAYSPRSDKGLSADTTEESIANLKKLAKEKLSATFLTDPEEAIMDAYYFYGTDNHLSTDGAKIHTEKIIERLKAALGAGGYK